MSKKIFLKRLFLMLLLFLGLISFFSYRWYCILFGDVGFDSILYTLLACLGGADSGYLRDFLNRALIPALGITMWSSAIYLYPNKAPVILPGFGKGHRVLLPVKDSVLTIATVILSVGLILYSALSVRLPQWIISLSTKTTLYEEYYTPPEDVSIEFPEQKRNLVFIMMESMETTFLTPEQGGLSKDCMIPELYSLAKDNVNFSETDKVGGWPAFPGTTWTIAGTVATTSGIPLSLPDMGNEDNMQGVSRFLPGACSIWELLEQQGYRNIAIMGSEGVFASTDRYLLTHGIQTLYDYETAREEGFIPSDYKAGWGMEDCKLYDYARQKLAPLMESGDPFTFTVSTIDTHAPKGFKCSRCGDRYEKALENVYACSSCLLQEFLDWLSTQPGYENTTVVIVGDHLSMAAEYFSKRELDESSRRVYNCILNSAVSAPDRMKNRSFTPMDFYPTILAAMGCEIPGERLGMGTNLFSDRPTLAEEMGMETFSSRTAASGREYMMRFIAGESKKED